MPDDAVALVEQELGEVGAVLAGDAGDECGLKSWRRVYRPPLWTSRVLLHTASRRRSTGVRSRGLGDGRPSRRILIIHVADGFRIVSASEGLQVSGSTATLTTTFSQDVELGLRYVPTGTPVP